MARTGRPPKPIEQKRLAGNPGKRPLPARSKTVALVPSTSAPVPATLQAAGRELWRTAQEQAPWLSQLDRSVLETLCALRDDQVAMRRQIGDDGLTVMVPIVTPAGHVVGEKPEPHPLLKELRAVEKQLRDFASALGFDPTARSRLGLAEVKRQSKVQELLDRQRGGPVAAQVIDIAADD
jgi:P27 family predicted phage terminase small subunit